MGIKGCSATGITPRVNIDVYRQSTLTNRLFYIAHIIKIFNKTVFYDCPISQYSIGVRRGKEELGLLQISAYFHTFVLPGTPA
jgi:hypothetical protein